MRNIIAFIATGAVSAVMAIWVYTSYASKDNSDNGDKALNCQVCKGSECVGCLEVFITTGINPFAPIDCDWWGSPETGSLPCGEPPGSGGGGGKAPWPPSDPGKKPCGDIPENKYERCIDLCLKEKAGQYLSNKIPDFVKPLYESNCSHWCGSDLDCKPPALKPGPCVEPMCRHPEER